MKNKQFIPAVKFSAVTSENLLNGRPASVREIAIRLSNGGNWWNDRDGRKVAAEKFDKLPDGKRAGFIKEAKQLADVIYPEFNTVTRSVMEDTLKHDAFKGERLAVKQTKSGIVHVASRFTDRTHVVVPVAKVAKAPKASKKSSKK
jgi:hypothetical protein